MPIFDVSMSIVVGKTLLPELSRELMITVLDFSFFLIDFYLEVFSNCLYLLDIFMVILKKSSNFSYILFFNIYFEVISSYLASGIVFVPFGFRGIEDKRAPKCIQYLGKNVIELFTISSKTPSFFIYA